MLARIGPDGTELPGRILHITEEMLSLPQPVTYTCIARNQVDMTNQHPQQQQQQERVYRSVADANTYEVKTTISFTVGQ